MEQTVSTALITAIIAVVIGALGLIGGLIGYVQGTAALRRATLTRQRAAAAEEAALQARTQAEQAARTAQSVLDRLTGLRSTAEVADLPTGPLVLPPRRSTAPTGPAAGVEEPPQQPAVDAPLASTTPTPEYFAPAAESAPAEDTWAANEAAPAPAEPAIAASASPFDRPADAPGPVSDEPSRAPQATGPTPVQTAAAEDAARRADAAATTSHGLMPIASDAGPVPFASLSSAPSGAGPTTVAPSPDSDEDGSSAPVEQPVDAVSTAAPPMTNLSDAPAEEPAARDEAEPTAEADGPTTDPSPVGAEPPISQRSSTGQITAGTRGTAPLDWAEALRTGAIPLPARSRGTYSAPSKAKGQPVGPARFEIRAVGRQRYEAVNVGGATAEQASLEGAGDDSHLVRPVEARPKPVLPGGSLAFSVLRVEGREVSVRISWMLNGDEEQAELPVP